MKSFKTGFLNVFNVFDVINLKALWRRFENGAYIDIKDPI